MRVQDAPRFRESAAVLFDSFGAGAQAVRALSQSGLHPSNCRLLDPGEAALTGAAPDGQALLVLGFESADHELGPWLARALELCADHGGRPRERRGESEGTWRDAFLQAPYLRDTLVAAGILAETFETAITWDRFESLVDGVREGAREALGGQGVVTCRLTHVYPDGAAPYFTVLAPARRGEELEQWAELKLAASEAIVGCGRHHHAPPRGRPRPQAVVRPPASRPVRLSSARREVRRGPGGHPQSGRPDRPLRRSLRGKATRTGPRRQGAARTVAATAAPALARGSARERLRGRRGRRGGARGHRPPRARFDAPARARAGPGRPARGARAPRGLHTRALRPLWPGGPDHGAHRRRALDASEPRAHDEGCRGSGACLRAALRDRAPVRRAGRRAHALTRRRAALTSSASPRS